MLLTDSLRSGGFDGQLEWGLNKGLACGVLVTYSSTSRALLHTVVASIGLQLRIWREREQRHPHAAGSSALNRP